MSGASLWGFIGRRALAALLVVVIVSAVTFAFIHLAPGGPEESIGGQFSTPEQRQAIRAKYRLDDALPIQYWRFLSDAARFEFGNSLTTREPVEDAIAERMKVTAPLVLISFALIVSIGVALGTIAAHRQGSPADRALVGLSVAGAGAPVFATAIILLFVFGVELGWFPTFGTGEGFANRAEHLVLPVVALTISGVAAMLKITRTRVAEVLREDHVTFARARGLSRRYLLSRSVLRNSGIQIVTQSGAILLALIAGAILVEVTFDLDGVGALFVKAISTRDIPLIQAVTVLITLFIVLVNLLVDLLYFALDPRVRHAAAGRPA